MRLYKLLSGWKRESRKRAFRIVVAASACLLSAGLVAPFVNASAFAPRIQRALERALGRPVAFQQVHFTLLSGPGFTLKDVSIAEDPRFGLEPFAYVPSLQAGVRLDVLLRGHLAISSLRLDGASINIVKREDGAWNVVEVVNRLAAPSRLPVNLFPAFSVSDARLDFKLGDRKTVLYVAGTDVSLYPQRSGKLYLRFSGSPARTDRAGTGFGHLRGEANWYLQPETSGADQLQADIALDSSNLSEITTLFRGEDLGVHGMIASHAHIEGPLQNLRVEGDLQLSDVHRWDLLPSSGDAWRVGYRGTIDVWRHVLQLETVAEVGAPLGFRLHVADFAAKPVWSVIASLNSAQASDLLPLCKRMGVPIPPGLRLRGSVDGAIGYSTGAGLSGSAQLKDVSAQLPDLPPLRASELTATMAQNRISFEPAEIETAASGAIRVGGAYDLQTHQTFVTLEPLEFPAAAVRDTVAVWFGEPDPLRLLNKGTVSGQMIYQASTGAKPAWSGDFAFQQAEFHPAGFAQPVTDARGHVRFDANGLEVDQFSATVGADQVSGSYRARAGANEPERLKIALPAADLHDVETILEPTLTAENLLARLGVERREIPAWLAGRRVEADLNIGQFSINSTALGALKTHLVWNGTRVQFPGFQLQFAGGSMRAKGNLSVAASTPEYSFSATIPEYRWRGGVLRAQGELRTSGTGVDALQHLRAKGTFTGEDINLSDDDSFDSVSGAFEFALADGWPDLHVSHLEAADGAESWTGAGATQSDGKLILDLEREGRQRRVVSTLEPATPVSWSGRGMLAK